MSKMPERVTVWNENFLKDDRRWMDAKIGHGGTEYVRADLFESLLSEVTNITQESVAKAACIARLEGEVKGLRSLVSKPQCNHFWGQPYRDQYNALWMQCGICGAVVKV